MRFGLLTAAVVGLGVLNCGAVIASEVADDFPRFVVPGYEAEMESLRELYWAHYERGGPMATLWDEWLSESTLWPAVSSGGRMDDLRRRWRKALSNRIIDEEGYVATHQHPSIAHQLGWPFPYWSPGTPGSWGWHFSLEGVPGGWHHTEAKKADGWTVVGASDGGLVSSGWKIELTAERASVATPPLEIDVQQSPFIQMRWRSKGLIGAQPYVEWTTAEQPEYSPSRRMYFAVADSNDFVRTMIPMYRHPEWRDRVTGLRIQFGNLEAGGSVDLQAIFTQYDTRHNVNNQCFIKGCMQYVYWTGDITFLREQIQRMRLALRYLMAECRGLEEKCIVTPFVGHCGRSGIQRDADGNKRLLFGRGIGNNYWDLLPFGRRDAYATMHYYDTLVRMAELERAIAAHPQWNISGGPLRFDAEMLERHAAEVKEANSEFWNRETGRFVLGIDDEGESHDYGFTFMNLEAIYYDYASPSQSSEILNWITGRRSVDGDTAQGEDIYHWRFAPRATTKRNVDYYGWFWSAPESIPWGGQVQDGGAVLGFSYHDLMARLRVNGADDAWNRLRAIIDWYNEVQGAGGPRSYYAGGDNGTLQGCGTPGGLGVDCEFFESILVPQVMIRGILGLDTTPAGLRISPKLPTGWAELTIDRIHYRNRVMSVRCRKDVIELMCVEDCGDDSIEVELPQGKWNSELSDSAGVVVQSGVVTDGKPIRVDGSEWAVGGVLRFEMDQ